MSDVPVSHAAPPVAGSNLDEVLSEADSMLAAMASRSLSAVAELAGALAVHARGTGASKIAEAAEAIRDAASGHDNVALAVPMRRLNEAISVERRLRHAEGETV